MLDTWAISPEQVQSKHLGLSSCAGSSKRTCFPFPVAVGIWVTQVEHLLLAMSCPEISTYKWVDNSSGELQTKMTSWKLNVGFVHACKAIGRKFWWILSWLQLQELFRESAYMDKLCRVGRTLVATRSKAYMQHCVVTSGTHLFKPCMHTCSSQFLLGSTPRPPRPFLVFAAGPAMDGFFKLNRETAQVFFDVTMDGLG